MKKKIIAGLVAICLSCLSLSGCAWMVLGVGVAGGYAISKDAIAGELDKDYDSIWTAAEKVSSIMGTVKNKDRTKGFIDADVDKARVSINIERLTPETLRLKVSARKYMMPNIALAQKIFVKINQEIE
ncbi:MAG: DUF3568 family protein [Candidatus Omnitrophota bacterium]|nr:DUF3568 family protein [Candidatus Omnitrophota bacterium]